MTDPHDPSGIIEITDTIELNVDLSAAPGAKVRFPIAVKLILASTALVLVISAAFVAEGLYSTQKQYKQFSKLRKETEIASLANYGLSTARNISDSIKGPLLDGDLRIVDDTVIAVAKGQDIFNVTVIKPNRKIVGGGAKGETFGEHFPANKFNQLKILKKAVQLDNLSGDSIPKFVAFGMPIGFITETTRRILGYLYFELSTTRIVKAMQEIEVERKKAVRGALIKTIALGLAALLFGLILAVLQGLRFSKAIRHLAQVAIEVGRGNLKARAQATTKDEIGVLCDQFNEMTSRIDTLLKESVEKAALDQELERANAIQTLLMPSREMFDFGGLDYCGMCESATQMGGDWWHHYQLSEDRVLLCVGDVTGHGIPSAMLTASTKACCDTVLHNNPNVDLSQFMYSLDHTIREAGKGELVMTFFAAVFDANKMTVEFANAGHNFPIMFRQGKLKSLIARGGRLGDGTEFESCVMPIENDDLVVFYTDGIIECENSEGEEYGMRRFKRKLMTNQQLTPIELRDTLLRDAYKFYGETPRIDDITLVTCRVH